MAEQEPGVTETLLVNKQNEVTEGNVSNVFIKQNGMWITPKADCLLGIMRSIFIKERKQKGETVQEKAIKIADLQKADEVWVTNAIRGVVRVKNITNLAEF